MPREPDFYHSYGCVKDAEDPRDLWYEPRCTPHLEKGVQKLNLDSKCPPVYDQGNVGSCTANAIAAAYQFDEMKEDEENVFRPSRLFIYYNERALEGCTDRDTGASLRDGMKTINQKGVCPEDAWPYDVSKLTDEPPEECYQEAKKHHAVKYHRVNQDLQSMKNCLINGYPFVFGFLVFSSFETQEVATTGKMPMPEPDDRHLGGHAVMAVGFDDDKQAMVIRNSWGPTWGNNGYFYMPYAFITDPGLCFDFWVVTRVQDDGDSEKNKQDSDEK